MVLLCLACHRGIHHNEPLAATQGWLVWADPEMAPVLLSAGWALLVPDGSLERLGDDEAQRLLEYVNGVSQAS